MLRELYDEPISDDEFVELVERPVDKLGIVEIRRMMIRLGQIDRERNAVKEILAAVVDSYQAKIAKHDRDEAMLRDRLHAFVRVHGNASFPDVGTAYLSPQKAKVVVSDEKAAKAWAINNGFAKTVPDTTAAKNALFQRGEVPPPQSGMEWVPETETLVVRGINLAERP